jgi:hypothetical protein
MIVKLEIVRQGKRGNRRDAGMVVSKRRHMLGFSYFGVVRDATLGCAVVTAPESHLIEVSALTRSAPRLRS